MKPYFCFSDASTPIPDAWGRGNCQCWRSNRPLPARCSARGKLPRQSRLPLVHRGPLPWTAALRRDFCTARCSPSCNNHHFQRKLINFKVQKCFFINRHYKNTYNSKHSSKTGWRVFFLTSVCCSGQWVNTRLGNSSIITNGSLKPFGSNGITSRALITSTQSESWLK